MEISGTNRAKSEAVLHAGASSILHTIKRRLTGYVTSGVGATF